MKICTKCKQDFLEVEFPLINTKTGKRSYMCVKCKRQYDREHYNKHKERRVPMKKVNSAKLRIRNLQYIIDYLKQNPCVDCGENDFVVLEFDHQYDKKANIADMKSRCSLKTIKDEIDKCEVVCANCHKRRTAKQFGYYKSIGENI